jgi:ligand-binding SRPBCC domain-containing protein
MRHYQHEFQVNAPVERVADFHRSTEALKALMPPPLLVSFNHIEPMREGSRADFTIWFGPLPVRWIAVHSQVNPLEGFTDTQVEGPFEYWVHQHTFEPVDENLTRVIDQIEGHPSRHPFWGMVSRFMWYTLPILFYYRARQTRKAVERQ